MHPLCSRAISTLLLGLLVPTLHAQNTPRPASLFLDGGFDVGTFDTCAMGALPHTWTVLAPTPDTYTVSPCAAADGMPVGTGGHFAQSLQPQSGRRFAAGCWCWGVAETFGTSLLTPLVAGIPYTLTGQFSCAQTHVGNGGYEVWLRAPSGSWITVGTIGQNAARGTWSNHTSAFVAPFAATELALAPLAGPQMQWSYNAIDDLILSPSGVGLPPGVYAVGGESPGMRGGPILTTAAGAPGIRDFWITHGARGHAAVIVFGLSTLNLPFLGGVVVPSLDIVWAIPIGSGGVSVPLPPGTAVYAQAWVLDSTHPAGITASPALLAQ